MFKNRVRTAALAGAVALATGLSGFSVPAFAQTAQDGYNAADGSASAPAVSENITEAQLLELTNETEDFLKVWNNARTWVQVVNEYINLGEDGFDPSEEAAQLAFAGARDSVSAELAKASANIQKARNSVKYAKEADEQAETDTQALVDALNAYREIVNPLIRKANHENETSGRDRLPRISTIDEATKLNSHRVYQQVVALEAEVNSQHEQLGIWSMDQNFRDYITRDHAAAVVALWEATTANSASVKAAWDKAVASNREAQLSDVLVRQLFLERATAQRDTLRALEAFYSVSARYVELYQDTDLVGERKANLRTLYRNTLDNIRDGIDYNFDILNQNDSRAKAFFLHWNTDLRNNDDQDAYDRWKAQFATFTYMRIFENGRIWQEAVERVEGIDADLVAERKAEQERLERERKMAEDLAKIAEGKTNSGSSSFKLSS